MRQDNRLYDVDWIKATYPVEYVIQRDGVALQPVGGKYQGLCPLHRDSDPSLWVYPDTRSWSCFGCPPKTGGDVIKWVQLRHNLGFLDACAHLTGMPVPEVRAAQAQRNRGQPVQWERLTASQQLLMTSAAAIYQDCLWRAPLALAYLQKRGLSEATIRTCGLGYCDGQAFAAFVEREEWTTRTALRLGLLRGSARPTPVGDSRETLAGRIIIPERRGGQAIWFIARVLQTATPRTATSQTGAAHGESVGQHRAADADPKYLALRGERPLLGYEWVTGRPRVFVCEGPFDYLTAVQWGLPACCTCGPYLPIERLAGFAGAERVYGLHDADHGGDAGAAWLGQQFGSRFQRVALPPGFDLNELGAASNGRRRFAALLRQSGVTLEASHAA